MADLIISKVSKLSRPLFPPPPKSGAPVSLSCLPVAEEQKDGLRCRFLLWAPTWHHVPHSNKLSLPSPHPNLSLPLPSPRTRPCASAATARAVTPVPAKSQNCCRGSLSHEPSLLLSPEQESETQQRAAHWFLLPASEFAWAMGTEEGHPTKMEALPLVVPLIRTRGRAAILEAPSLGNFKCGQWGSVHCPS